MTNVIRVHTTAGSEEEASNIARTLLSGKLAACVQISGPVQSSYWWDGQLQQDEEWTCTIKTLAAAYREVEAAIREVHSYDEPQIVATEVIAGSDAYLQWVAESVAPATQR